MSEVDLNNGIIIGSNKDTEWMLPWWFERLREYNPYVHVSVHDYGLSEGMKQFLLNNDR